MPKIDVPQHLLERICRVYPSLKKETKYSVVLRIGLNRLLAEKE